MLVILSLLSGEDIFWRCLWLSLPDMAIRNMNTQRMVLAGLSCFTFCIPSSILRQLGMRQRILFGNPKEFECLDFAQPSLKLMLELGELEWFCHRNQTRLLWCERATKVNWGRNRGQEEFLWDWLTIWPFCVRNKVQTLSMYFLSFHVVLFHAQLCIRRVIWIKLNYEGFPFLVH